MVDISLLSRFLRFCLPRGHSLDGDTRPGTRLHLQRAAELHSFPDAWQTGHRTFCRSRALPAGTKTDTFIMDDNEIYFPLFRMERNNFLHEPFDTGFPGSSTPSHIGHALFHYLYH